MHVCFLAYLIRLLGTSTTDIREMLDEEYPTSQFIDYKAGKESPLPMIYQSGYLTTKEYNQRFEMFKLDISNDEVRNGFTTALASNYLGTKSSSLTTEVAKAVRKLDAGDIDGFMADKPYTMRRDNSEKGTIEDYGVK